MKNVSLSGSDTNWIERVAPTAEQSASLKSATPEQRRELLAALRKPAAAEDAAAAQALYDQHKIAEASLISCGISLPRGTGIINCRVNGEHKQIRFDGERVIEPYVVGK